MSSGKLTGRGKRMEHIAGLHRNSGLNLVSLMDIFTILVFFLLVSSGSQQLTNAKDIKLPTSTAQTVPKETLVILITQEDILVQGTAILSIDEALASTEDSLAVLVKELEFHAQNRVFSGEQAAQGHAVTIMGDENTPYQLLSKIMASCRQSNYLKIAFAANQTSKSKG